VKAGDTSAQQVVDLALDPRNQERDRVCVFYGTMQVFLLRRSAENPEEWCFIEDAFVYDLRELDETLQSARGADEVSTTI